MYSQLNRQALATKLGCVTGLDLAQMNRAYLPPWLNLFLYFIAEGAIICTDIGQVSFDIVCICSFCANCPR